MKGLLAGIRVLDLSRHLAGPYGSMLMADLGADVIKVESADGDPTRYLKMHSGESLHFISVNRNKRSIVLDLKAPTDREILFDLVRRSDVVYDNFKPGVMERLGLSHDDLLALNPRLVVCSITGFGLSGPYRDRVAYDLTIQAISGGMSITGEPGRPPVRAGIPIADLAAGIFAAFAICAALHRRDADGVGQKLDISLLDCQVSMLSYVAAYYLNTGVVPGPVGSGHVSLTPYGALATSDGHVVVAIWGEGFWGKLCNTIGRSDLAADPRFAANEVRVTNRAELERILAPVMARRTTEEWLRIFNAEGIPAGPVNTMDRVFSDPHVLAREMLQQLDQPIAGAVRVVGNPIKSDDAPTPARPAPRLNEQAREILQSVLGYDDAQVAAYERTHVHGSAASAAVGVRRDRPAEV